MLLVIWESGVVWVDFWVTLGGFGEALGRLWKALGRLWGDFGRLWEGFGETFGGRGETLGGQQARPPPAHTHTCGVITANPHIHVGLKPPAHTHMGLQPPTTHIHVGL